MNMLLPDDDDAASGLDASIVASVDVSINGGDVGPLMLLPLITGE